MRITSSIYSLMMLKHDIRWFFKKINFFNYFKAYLRMLLNYFVLCICK